MKTQNGIYSSYPLLIALAEKHYNIAKYLLEYGTLINYVEFSNNNLFAKTICFITQYYKVKFASSDESDNVNKSGVFNNSKNIIGFIKNWPKFDYSYRKYSSSNFEQEQRTFEINEGKILEAQHLIKSIIHFFYDRQKGLEQLLAKGKLEKSDPDKPDSTDVMYKITKNMCKKEINWQRLEDNLFYKYVLHNIMSGEIALYAENADSNDIINELGLFVKIFLFYKSKFLNKNFEYQGEKVDKSKLNEQSSFEDTVNLRKNALKGLYPMNQDNYQAIENWKNINFFKIIEVGKNMKIINSEDYLKNKKTELIMLIAGNKTQDASKIAELTNICKNKDISGLIHLPLEVWWLIASFLDLESYSKFLSPEKAIEENTTKITKHMEEYANKNLDINSYFEQQNYDNIRTEYAKIIGENNILTEADLI